MDNRGYSERSCWDVRNALVDALDLLEEPLLRVQAGGEILVSLACWTTRAFDLGLSHKLRRRHR